MTETRPRLENGLDTSQDTLNDTAPGDERHDRGGIAQGIYGYLVGVALAGGFTIASFIVAQTGIVWPPALAVALVTLAIAQMGVHLVFFIHITSGPDSLNNVLALAFGLLVVFLILAGSIWIMQHLDTNMVSMSDAMKMQR